MEKLKKWGGILISILLSVWGMYIISVPILLLGFFIANYQIEHHNTSLGNLIIDITMLIPILLTLYFIWKLLKEDILVMVQKELDPSGEPVLINPQEQQYDPINKKIVSAFNKAKEKLGLQDRDIKLIRMVGSENVNAFAISNIKGESAITVFDGIAYSLDEPALQAVIGHEMGHIKNMDSITTVSLYASQYSLPILQRSSEYIINFFNNIFGNIPYVNLVYMMFVFTYRISIYIYIYPANFLLKYVNLFVSRKAEHLADEAGAIAAGKNAMIRTLEFLGQLEAQQSAKKTPLLEMLTSTHPPTAERIEYLKSIELR